MHIQLTYSDALGLLDWIFVDDFYPCGQPLSSDVKATILDHHFPRWWERDVIGHESSLGQFAGSDDDGKDQHKRTTIGFDEFARFFNRLYHDVLAGYPRIEGQGLAQVQGLAQGRGREISDDHSPDHSGYVNVSPTDLKAASLPLDSSASVATKLDHYAPNADNIDDMFPHDVNVVANVIVAKKKVDRVVTSLQPKLSTRQSEAIMQRTLHNRRTTNIQLFHSQKEVAIQPKHHRPESHHPVSSEAKDKDEAKDDQGISLHNVEGHSIHNPPISTQVMVRRILQRKTTNLKYIKSNVVLAAAGEDPSSDLLSRFQLSGGVLQDDSMLSSPDKTNQTILLPNRLLLSPLSPEEILTDRNVPDEVIAQRKVRLMRNLLARPTTNPSLQRLGLISPIGSPGINYDSPLRRKEVTGMRNVFNQDDLHGGHHEEDHQDTN